MVTVFEMERFKIETYASVVIVETEGIARHHVTGKAAYAVLADLIVFASPALVVFFFGIFFVSRAFGTAMLPVMGAVDLTAGPVIMVNVSMGRVACHPPTLLNVWFLVTVVCGAVFAVVFAFGDMIGLQIVFTSVGIISVTICPSVHARQHDSLADCAIDMLACDGIVNG